MLFACFLFSPFQIQAGIAHIWPKSQIKPLRRRPLLQNHRIWNLLAAWGRELGAQRRPAPNDTRAILPSHPARGQTPVENSSLVFICQWTELESVRLQDDVRWRLLKNNIAILKQSRLKVMASTLSLLTQKVDSTNIPHRRHKDDEEGGQTGFFRIPLLPKSPEMHVKHPATFRRQLGM